MNNVIRQDTPISSPQTSQGLNSSVSAEALKVQIADCILNEVSIVSVDPTVRGTDGKEQFLFAKLLTKHPGRGKSG